MSFLRRMQPSVELPNESASNPVHRWKLLPSRSSTLRLGPRFHPVVREGFSVVALREDVHEFSMILDCSLAFRRFHARAAILHLGPEVFIEACRQAVMVSEQDDIGCAIVNNDYQTNVRTIVIEVSPIESCQSPFEKRMSMSRIASPSHNSQPGYMAPPARQHNNPSSPSA
jgi:hypothetical protein